MADTTIVEINGVKMEIDMRHAKVARVDTLRVGTRVKLMMKQYDGHKVCGGVVVGFDAFELLPTIRIAYVEPSYGIGSPLKFFSFNAESKDAELLIDDDGEELMIARETLLQQIDRDIESKRAAFEGAEQAREFFIRHFGALASPSSQEQSNG